jgi:hypothetical protein
MHRTRKVKRDNIRFFLDIHGSVHHDVLTKMTNKMQLCRIIYCYLTAMHVSSDIFAHYQELLNCITASGITHE